MPAGRPRAQAPSRYAGSIAAVADWFRETLPTVQNWARDPAFPERTTTEGYDLLAVARWEDRRGPGRQEPTAGRESLADAELRKKVADADKAEMSRDRERGALIDRSVRDQDLLAVVESFVSALENLPPKVVPLLTAARGHQEIDTILRDHIRTMRIQLAAKHSPRAVETTSEESE